MTRLAILFAAALVTLVGAQRPPLSLVLLIDVTGSVSEAMATARASETMPLVRVSDMMPNARGESAAKPVRVVTKQPNSPRDLFFEPVVEGVIRNLARGDRARIGSIARTLRLSREFSADREVLIRATRDALEVAIHDRYGPTPLWDGVDAAVTALETEPGRRVVVLVTDGLSTGNRHGLSAVILHATQSTVSISIVCESWGSPRSWRTGQELRISDNTGSAWKMMVWPFGQPPDVNLKRLASSTGGLFVTDGAGVNDPQPQMALASILEQLRREP